MTEYEKLRMAISHSLKESESLFCHRAFGTYGCAEGRDNEDECCKTEELDKLMAVILAALQEPTDEMHESAAEPFHKEAQKQARESEKTYGKIGFGSGPFSQAMWLAMINASPLVKP